MRAIRPFERVFLVGMPLIWLVGCDSPTDSVNAPDPANSSWEASTDLTSEYGGYTFVDEEPAFGDPEVAKIDDEEILAPVEPAALEMQRARFALRLLWGQLRGNPTMTEGTDWSGGIAVSAGAIGVVHTIGFEMRDEVLPRENRQQLRFSSHTQSHFDGLLLAVIEDGEDATFSFRSAKFQHTWRVSELRDIDVVIPVDDQGNAVAIQGIVVDATCPEGFLRGHWVKRVSEDRGVFRALWATSFGLPLGHIRGHFGITEEGQPVWFGKIIDRQGHVIGLARGQWVPADDPTLPGGTFEGHWRSRAGDRQGRVTGHYLPTRAGERGVAGFLAGRWGAVCDTPVEPASP